jgi:hypothetical protein
MAEEFEQRKVNKTVPASVRVGDLVSITHFARVKVVADGGQSLVLENVDDKSQFGVQGHSLVEASGNADRYTETKKLSQTDLIDVLMSSHNRPFTAVFDKKDGTERALRGRLVSPDGRRGRSHVEDLDLDGPFEKRLRQVDHRTLKSLTVDGIHYVTK